MTPSRHTSLAAALLCLAAFVLVGTLATFTPEGRSLDVSALQGFVALQPTTFGVFAMRFVHLFDPPMYAMACVALTGAALVQDRIRLAAAIPALFVATGLTTETLKL